jgi:hypothetical protein
MYRGSQGDVVYLGRPIAPSYYMSPNAGGGSCEVSAYEFSCAHGKQINFGDLSKFIKDFKKFQKKSSIFYNI